jgi:hypothetical protein
MAESWESVKEFLYDTSEKEVKVRSEELRRLKRHDCSETEI